MIRIGTSGFSFKDWKGTIYPENLSSQDTLIYYQKELGFDCVEINATYYTLLSDKTFAGMEKKTTANFEFVVKGFRGITHDPFDKRLADHKPDLETAMENVDRFVYSLQPIKEKDKLGGVLLQFPVFFYPARPFKDYILACKDKFEDIPLIIEFRNRAWAKAETFQFLKENDLSYCAVDEPRLPRLMPFINEVTSDIGYIRFHGRNRNWFNAPIETRYHYLYSNEELETFIPQIRQMDMKSKKTFIFFNNCHAGFAVKNALSLLNLLANQE